MTTACTEFVRCMEGFRKRLTFPHLANKNLNNIYDRIFFRMHRYQVLFAPPLNRKEALRETRGTRFV